MTVSTVVLFLCISPSPEHAPPIHIDHFDKVIHFLLYFGMTVIHYREFHRVQYYGLAQNLFKIRLFLVAFLFGLLIEILQYVMDIGRSFDLLDVLANCFGTWMGLLVSKSLNKSKI